MPGRVAEPAAPGSAWRVLLVLAVGGHLLLVPLHLAARHHDLARRPYGDGHWPSEPTWPAGSGSSEWGPGVVPALAGWLLLEVLLLVALVVGLLVTGLARLTGWTTRP